MRSSGIQNLSRAMRSYSRTAAFFLSQDTVETNLYCFIRIYNLHIHHKNNTNLVNPKGYRKCGRPGYEFLGEAGRT